MAIMAAENTSKTIVLRSKIDSSFSIEVGPQVIDSCSILKNVTEHTDNSEAVEVEMTPFQLKKFVELHNHFESSEAAADPEWTNAFFHEFTDAEFKDLCWKADYLDSQRFLEAAGGYVLSKFEVMDVPEISEYLNIVDDYTPEERKAMEAHPLEFFTGISIQQPQANN